MMYERSGYSRGYMSKGVKALLIITVSVFFLQLIFDRSPLMGEPGIMTLLFGLWPHYFMQGLVWQLFTYMFLHSNYYMGHLIFNMLALFLMGPETERTMGTRHFLILYFLSGILGGLGWILIANGGVCVGASGAIFGIIGAFSALDPHRPIVFLFLPMFRFKAWVFAVGLGVIQLLYLLSQQGGNIAYAVHLAGGIAGCIYALVIFRPEVFSRFPLRLYKIKGGFKVSGKNPKFHIVSSTKIDDILDKIAKQGMGSLDRKERRLLEETSKKKTER
ncbi:MAG: rhomboid family intramembrane serine protease [Kiritimatiellae bacterium]|nr:rhomboid family intramembrane serine protease [Kiritimatiellia bacterium]